MIYLLAQATDVVNENPHIEVTLPAAITFAGICGLVFLLIKLGDRLWRPKQGSLMGNDDLKGLCDNIDRLGNACNRNKEKIVENMMKLSEAMTRYIELQQASLRIAEYRHEAILKQLEIISGQSVESRNASQASQTEAGLIRERLNHIALNIEKLVS